MNNFSDFLENDELITLTGLKSFSTKQRENVKYLTQTSVWFGSQKIFRNPLQLPLQSFHKQIADALPQPSPDLPFAEWSEIKEAVILAFRGAAKTTIISGYVAQCILCDPDIRVRFVGGTLPKAAELVDMVRFHFSGNEVIRYLFPEFCKVSTSSSEFISPARKNLSLRDATLSSTSFRAANAGGRADLLILDDAATEANMSNSNRVAKSVSQYDDLAPIVEADGYTIFNGTRWAEDDIPASMAFNAEANSTELTWLEIPIFTVKTNQPNQSEIDKRNAEHKLNLETDVIFTWPDKWNARTVLPKYLKPNFDSQYLLRIASDPAPVGAPAIINPTPDLLHSLICCAAPPSENETFVLNGDLASVSEDGRDDCAIVSGIWNPALAHLTVSHIVCEKFTEEKAFLQAVRDMHDGCRTQSWNQVHFRIENVHEAKALWQSKFAALNMPAEFLYPSFDRGARERRVLKLFQALHSRQINFSQECGHWNDIIEQFCSYNPRRIQKKLDLLDSISQLWEYALSITTLKHVGFQLPLPDALDFDCEMGNALKPELSWREREMRDSGFSGSWAEYQEETQNRHGR